MIVRHTVLPNKHYDELEAARGKIEIGSQSFFYHVYFYQGVMIDTGPPRARAHINRFVEEKKPDKAFLTHYHEDHSGNASYLHRKSHLKVYSGQKTASILKHGFALPLYRKVIWGKDMEPFTPHSIDDTYIDHRDGRLLLIPSPGHSDDHYSLYDPKRKWLFAGDLFLAKQLRYGMREDSVPQMIQSLQTILQYDIEAVFCGHAGIVKQGKDALQAKLTFLLDLSDQTLTLKRNGYNTKRITEKLFTKSTLMKWVSANEFSPHHLVNSILKRE
ncbi:MBL fold metallo-hydrolase [Alteribacillus sp. YIM 98480]|uniref:MBL fold metallo-hydrolase n=1 Tax=Alteribacillus sp. YIM 98480 TaxID=2606599 RepID=UPI00131E4FC1|nr:MBL fold metallo-hydrolase [Alteribacillus sp. YIM 98480]